MLICALLSTFCFELSAVLWNPLSEANHLQISGPSAHRIDGMLAVKDPHACAKPARDLAPPGQLLLRWSPEHTWARRSGPHDDTSRTVVPLVGIAAACWRLCAFSSGVTACTPSISTVSRIPSDVGCDMHAEQCIYESVLVMATSIIVLRQRRQTLTKVASPKDVKLSSSSHTIKAPFPGDEEFIAGNCARTNVSPGQ